MARGLAVLAMFAFHFIWDLGHFGYISPYFPYSPGVKIFGHSIAIAFLFIAGVSLTLAGGRRFWRRFCVIAGAAAFVTLATYFAFPESYIFFGILHCIALASLVSAPLLFAPWPVALAASIAAALAPLVFSNALFNAPAWLWLGFSTDVPSSNDYRPLFPWLAAMLAGVAFAKAGGAERFAAMRSPKGLSWLGRHSLILYLLHQPAFFASFTLLALLFSASEADPGGFVAACESECVKSSATPAICRNACLCTAEETTRLRLLSTVADDAERGRRIQEIAQECFAKLQR
jgi:uncharacterized membrane protein